MASVPITIRLEPGVHLRIQALAAATDTPGVIRKSNGRSVIMRRLLESSLLIVECIGWDGLAARVEHAKDLGEAERRLDEARLDAERNE